VFSLFFSRFLSFLDFYSDLIIGLLICYKSYNLLADISLSIQVVNRIQKLRKTAQLEPSDPVDVYYKSVDDNKNTLQEILKSQVS
jgi:isoleucyl-tRNA synthetase